MGRARTNARWMRPCKGKARRNRGPSAEFRTKTDPPSISRLELADRQCGSRSAVPWNENGKYQVCWPITRSERACGRDVGRAGKKKKGKRNKGKEKTEKESKNKEGKKK